MKTILLGGVAAVLVMAAPAFASEELRSKCYEVTAAEGTAEGEGGCDCMVDKAAGDDALVAELLAIGDVAPEDRNPTGTAAEIIGECFPSEAG
ncbi:MAG: hypothetical protein AAF527_02350 [Pseudomonadota bacterium]